MAERLTEKDSIENKRYVLNSEDNQIILTSAKLKNGFRKTYYYGKPIEKLAQFEDIMEKYGIESVEELSDALEFAKVIEKTLSDYGINDNEELECVLEKSPKFVVNDNAEKCGQEINGVFFSNEQILILSQYNELQEPYKKRYEQVKTDRDTWEKACELACQIIISGYCDGMEDTTDWESAIYQWKEDNGIGTYGIGVEELLGYLLEQAKTEK